jgi:hypothetical protein
VNPLSLTRDAWVEIANRAQVSAIEIEVNVLTPTNTGTVWKGEPPMSRD